MRNVAYIRVSTDKQSVDSQKLAILSYAQKHGFKIDDFQEVVISSRHQQQRKTVENVLSSLRGGDCLIVSELSRLGRSLGVIIHQINKLIEQKINFIAVKEGLKIEDGKQDMQTKMMVAMFGLFAEVERDLISERTKEGLKNAKKAGKQIGRPKGKKGKSKLDGKEGEIAGLLDKKVSKASIAKIMGVSPSALKHFITSRKLEAGDLLKAIT